MYLDASHSQSAQFFQVMSVTLSICGVVLMAYADGFKGASWEGVLLSLLSAIGAALYKVCC